MLGIARRYGRTLRGDASITSDKKVDNVSLYPLCVENIKSFFAYFLLKESRSSLLLFGQRSLAGGADGFAVQLYRAGGYLAA